MRLRLISLLLFIPLTAAGAGQPRREPQATLNISLNSSGYGTLNPNSPTAGQGPYYSDLLRFQSSSDVSANITWNFGNPESSDNTISSVTGLTVIHQYSGITTSGGVSTPKQVTAKFVSDPSVTASTSVALLLPTPRVRIAASGVLLSSGGTTSAIIIPGDQFVDASDGSIESHYDGWNIDGSTFNRTPAESQPAGPSCGSHTLSLAANYIPYSVSGGSIIPRAGTSPYTVAVSGISYMVRPFAPKIQIASSTSSTITFQNAGRVAGPSAFTGGATWNVTWELATNGQPVFDQPTTEPVGSVSAFTIPKSQVNASSVVTLRLSMSPGSIVDSSCQTLATASASYLLCAGFGSGAVSINATPGTTVTPGTNVTFGPSFFNYSEQSCDTYSWNFGDGSSSSSRTPVHSFSSIGNKTVQVIVSHPDGSSITASLNITVAPTTPPPTCSAPISNTVFVTYTAPSACSDAPSAPPCLPNEVISFNAAVFGYNVQTCDAFTWTFGDGATAAGRTPTHVYSSAGRYSVSVRISNTAGSVTSLTQEVRVGQSCAKGDVDGNGLVNPSDAVIVLQSVVRSVVLTTAQACAADYDSSGTVDTADAILILKCYLSLGCR